MRQIKIPYFCRTKNTKMIRVDSFGFNPFQENTYILSDETKECVIIDPGCYDQQERRILTDFITNEKLFPVRILNTHCHIDHVLGNHFVTEKYKLGVEIHTNEIPILKSLMQVAQMYGVPAEDSPDPTGFLEEGNTIKFGNSVLDILFTPGHSPGSITFYNKADRFVISGDVLFFQSIGRTDLPGGDFDTLIQSIKEKLFPLGDDVKVYSGHGPSTMIGFEKKNNPFLQ